MIDRGRGRGTPEHDALRAIFEFLNEQEELECEWWNEGILSMKWVKCVNHKIWRLYFVMGKLAIAQDPVSVVDYRGTPPFVQFFDIADPDCFDQIVDAVRGRAKPIESKSVFDGGRFLFDG